MISWAFLLQKNQAKPPCIIGAVYAGFRNSFRWLHGLTNPAIHLLGVFLLTAAKQSNLVRGVLRDSEAPASIAINIMC